MSNKNAVFASFTIICDGVSNTFSVDLSKDPYLLQGNVPNWFADENRVATPTGAFSSDSNITPSLSGNILTLTFSTVPSAGPISTGIYIEF